VEPWNIVDAQRENMTVRDLTPESSMEYTERRRKDQQISDGYQFAAFPKCSLAGIGTRPHRITTF